MRTTTTEAGMRKKKQLESLETLAHGHETRWQRHASDQLRNLRAEEKRLEQLDRFVSEYNGADPRQSASQSIMTMRTQRQFVDRLRDAARQQRQTVEVRKEAAERGVDHWKQARAKRLAIQKYSERKQEVEDRQRDRRAQTFLDEIGRNTFLSRRK